MRRFDKKKNIKKANLILETRRLVEQADPMDIIKRVVSVMQSQERLDIFDGDLDTSIFEYVTGVNDIGLRCEFKFNGEASGEDRAATRLQPEENVEFEYSAELLSATLVDDSGDVLFRGEDGNPINFVPVIGELKMKLEYDVISRYDDDVLHGHVFGDTYDRY